MHMRSVALVFASAAILVGTALPAAATTRTTITFEEGMAPCFFYQTQPLGEAYASLGIHFHGPADGEGGAILNRCGRFGVHARSGEQFLAFNVQDYALLPETITFDAPVTQMTCFVASGSREPATYRLIGMRSGQVVSRTAITVKSGHYTGLSVRAHLGIDTVILKAAVPRGFFVVDDLSFKSLE